MILVKNKNGLSTPKV